MIKVLILCTGNSCRSQMAQGFLKSFDKNLDVYSAGTKPSLRVDPIAISVMKEVGIDISDQKPVNVKRYMDTEWDFVITVCDNAREACPVFTGTVKHRLHMVFGDPSEFKGSKENVIKEYQRIRDEIRKSFLVFYNEKLK